MVMLGCKYEYKVKHFCGISLYSSISQDLLHHTLPLECSILKVEFINLQVQ